MRKTKENYGWDPDAHFLVPDEALEHFRECCERGAEFEREWKERFDAYREAHPEEARGFADMLEGRMPDGFDADPPRFEAGESMATRKASGAAIQWAAERVPHLVGGAADLATSTNTDIDDAGDVQRGPYEGRNLRFGVREHGMGAIVNGLTLHGFRGYGSTFLIFSDYMRGRHPARRRCRSCPRSGSSRTTRSASARTARRTSRSSSSPACAPCRGSNVIRPADANETVLGWRYALRQTEAPTAFALSRQDLPILDPDSVPDDAIERGAYVLRDAANGGEPELILIATGSEVSLAMEAAEQLDGEGVGVGWSSMPCMDTLHGGRRGLPRRGAAALLPGARGRRGRQPDGLVSLGRRRRRLHRHGDLRRVRALQGRLRALRHHRRADRRDGALGNRAATAVRS